MLRNPTKTGKVIKASEKLKVIEFHWNTNRTSSIFLTVLLQAYLCNYLFISKFIFVITKLCSFNSSKFPRKGKGERYFKCSQPYLLVFPALSHIFALCGTVKRELVWLPGRAHCWLAVWFRQVSSVSGLHFLSFSKPSACTGLLVSVELCTLRDGDLGLWS